MMQMAPVAAFYQRRWSEQRDKSTSTWSSQHSCLPPADSRLLVSLLQVTATMRAPCRSWLSAQLTLSTGGPSASHPPHPLWPCLQSARPAAAIHTYLLHPATRRWPLTATCGQCSGSLPTGSMLSLTGETYSIQQCMCLTITLTASKQAADMLLLSYSRSSR